LASTAAAGLPHRFEAFRLMALARAPVARDVMRGAADARTGGAVSRLRRELEGLAGHVNGKYAEFDWADPLSQQDLLGIRWPGSIAWPASAW
jgi:hypothetical protein